MTRYAKYPAYKDSGVEWIGEIPEHWDVKRLKQTMRLITKKTNEETQNVALENIESWTGKHIPSDTEFEGEGINFQVGDLLFGKLRPYLAKAYLAEFPGAAVGDFHVMRPDTKCLYGRYAFYVILNHGVISIINGSTFGAKMPRVSWDFMANVQLPIPSFEEQQAIANFLDRKTTQIDELIANKEALLKILDEKRAALITKAVTKGIDPSIRMKDSGIEWIGEIPKHWEVKRLKQTMCLITEKSSTEIQNVALENIESWTGKHIPSDTEFEGDGITFQVGDILFGKLRPYLAKAYLAEFPGAAVGDFHVIRLTNNMSSSFALHLILSNGFISIIDGSTFGAKMPRASWDFMGNMQLPIPPLKEQQAIASFLDKTTTRIDRQKAQITEAIERLKEYRIALITDTVTGNIQIKA